MIYLICAVGGFVVGGVLAWAIAADRVRGALSLRLQASEQRAHDAQVEASTLQGKTEELRRQVQRAAEDFEALRAQLALAREAKVKAETSLEETTVRLEEERKLLEEAKSRLTETFKALAGDTLSTSTEAFLKLAKETLGSILEGAKGDLGQRQEAIQGLVSPLSESLRQLEQHVRSLESAREGAYRALTEQISALSASQQQLQKETGSLITALRTPKTVGAWGQVALERAVELSGMTANCDFTREVSVTAEDGRLRPDLVVHLPGGREIVVDAKAGFDAYYEAVSAESAELRDQALKRHAANVRAHMIGLSSKEYWRQFEPTPEMVVMFIPGESFFAAAVDTDRNLMEDAWKRHVVLASPTTLVALLRAVAYGWRQEQIAQNAQAISDLGKQLYERMRTLADHLTNVGNGLERANTAYNQAVASMEARVLPAARRFKELGAATGSDIPVIEPLEVAPRALTAPDLGEDAE
jgi:DNA recombination protein RmuC